MPELVIHSENFPEGYRLTSTSDGLRIEPIGRVQHTFTLSTDHLARFGLRFDKDQHYLDLKPGQEPEGVLDQILGSLSRAIELVQSQRNPAAWRWDLENLRRAWVVLGGLDEEGVQRILAEEEKT